jgi:UDP-N-acetylglucosamine 2-epimerase (non-hydrolysing)
MIIAPIKVLIVFGTRPEAIKMAPVIKELERREPDFSTVVCLTSQHREMQDQILKLFNIESDYDLNIMTRGQSLNEIASRVLIGVDQIIAAEKPDYVLTQGDTSSAFAASFAAFNHRVRIGHVEAGLRTGRKYEPFPEEINRKMISVLTDVHFAPTEKAKQNLIREGVNEESIFVTGNTVIDALQEVLNNLSAFDGPIPGLENISFDRPIILVTGHRRENFGMGLKNLCTALATIAKKYPQINIVYPVHLNPNVRTPVYSLLGSIKNIYLINPLDYPYFVYLMQKAHFIISDSGGIQEEGTAIGTSVLVTRSVTERPEAIESGSCNLVGTLPESIVSASAALIEDKKKRSFSLKHGGIFGDGFASKHIADVLADQPHLIHEDSV